MTSTVAAGSSSGVRINKSNIIYIPCSRHINFYSNWLHYNSVIEASRSHSDTPHSVGLLWTSDQLDAETSTWQLITLTRDRHPCCQRDSNPQSQQASGPRPTPHIAWPLGSAIIALYNFIVLRCIILYVSANYRHLQGGLNTKDFPFWCRNIS